jgi:hypothetical protein
MVLGWTCASSVPYQSSCSKMKLWQSYSFWFWRHHYFRIHGQNSRNQKGNAGFTRIDPADPSHHRLRPICWQAIQGKLMSAFFWITQHSNNLGIIYDGKNLQC